MAKIFITGSTDGLGQLTAESLINRGHQVVLHARNEHRFRDAQKSIPDAEAIVKGDLSSIEETISLAEAVDTKLITMDKQILRSFPDRCAKPLDVLNS